MKDKEKQFAGIKLEYPQYVSMKEILTKRSFEPITNCNCNCKIESRIEEQTELQKEIEAMQYFANKNAVSILDIVNTCSVEKQIDEMAKDIYEQKSCDTSYEANCKLLAYDLVTLGWVKLPEDSVVLTMTEHAKLVAQVRDEFEHEYKDKVVLSMEEFKEKIKQVKDLEKNYYKKVVIPQERKETAERDFNHIIKALEKGKERVKAFYGIEESVGADVAIRTVKELAKHFGVEIKE